MRQKATILLCLLFTLQLLLSQELTLPYSNSFEDPIENGTWTLNAGKKGAKCTDKWHIGEIESIAILEGSKALYISNSDGDKAELGEDNNVVVVYKEISLPSSITQRKRLDLTFDWKTLVPSNKSASLGSGIRVALVPENFPNDVESNDNSGLEPTEWLVSTKLTMTLHDGTKSKILRNNGAWKSAHTQLTMTPGDVYKLVFVWINEGKHEDEERILGACIDNIQITSADCPMPTALVINDGCDSTVISWPGSMGSAYDFEYRQSRTEQWTVISGVTENRYTIPYLQEGMYDFRVKSVCDTEVSAYRSSYSSLVFCPDNHCINYIDLNSEDIQCYIGKAVVGDDGGFAPVDPVDYGYQAATSRHTVHWDPIETDSRTGGKLKTVPPGEFASIRIGDFLSGANSERIEIDYFVDTEEASVLLLNYAIIFQEPDHEKEEQPYFRLRLMTSDGYELSPTCGKSEFYADPESAEWNRVDGVAWKDWAYLGFDLTMFDGQTLVIELDVRDCTQGAHYSYAYFALGCAKGELAGVSCGAVDTMILEAPLGFDYEWYIETAPENILSTDQHYVARSADETYICRCISKIAGAGECDFVMKTKISPRVPHADIITNHKPVDCLNIVELVNNSDVDTKKDGNMVCTGEKISDVHWVIDGGNKMYGDTIYHTMPNDGGQLNAKLVAAVEGGCMDTLDININVPSIMTTTDTIYETLCFGESIDFEKRYPGGGIFGIDTTAIAYLTNSYGCDSIRVLVLDVKDRIIPIEHYDTICIGDTLTHDGKHYTEEGKYKIKYKTDEGCDSTFILHVATYPEITFTLELIPEQGAPNTGEIIIKDAPVNYTYKINGDLNAPLTELGGGSYEVIIISDGCESVPQVVTIDSDCLVVSLDSAQDVCADEENILLPITILEGFSTTYSIEYDSKAIASGFVNVTDEVLTENVVITLPEVCRPNVYTANVILDDVVCENLELAIEFTVLYSSSIMTQKWNDVIALLSSEYNGGYEFSKYQWYRNGEALIEDEKNKEDGPYLYLNGDNFNLNDEYSVLLTRLEDSVSMMTCIMAPIMKNDVNDYPTRTLADRSQKIALNNISGNGVATWYDIQGRMCGQYDFSDNIQEITTPNVAGFYVLEIVTENDRIVYKVYIK